MDAHPGHLSAAFALGIVLSDQGRWAEAEDVFHTITRLDPGHADAHHARGDMLKHLGCPTEGILCQARALGSRADFPQAWAALGAALTDCGRLEEALAAYRRSLDLAADPAVHSALCHALCLMPAVTREDLDREHRAWNGRYAEMPPFIHANRPDPARRLRIGYVSADFRDHAVARFVEPVLASHDRAGFEVFGYATGPLIDAVTMRLMGLADHWRDVHGLPCEAVAQRIRDDGIDILVDLGGHGRLNNLPVFAKKPAPVQVTWLGYPESTGLPAMDGKITDAVVCPEGERFATEAPLRLPRGFHCYRPPADAPAVTPPPRSTNGFVTFGAFHPAAKVGPPVVAAWAAILRRVPGSRLRLKTAAFADAVVRDRYRAMFAVAGIAGNRLDLLSRTETTAAHLAAHLMEYGAVDIALDAFPCNGTTTTCEALWMGVPVITLAGDRPAGRMSASLLHQIGLDEFVAKDIGDYIDLACTVAHDHDLEGLRAGLRPRIATSTLGDATAFTHDLEEALRGAWRSWCVAQVHEGRPETLPGSAP